MEMTIPIIPIIIVCSICISGIIALTVYLHAYLDDRPVQRENEKLRAEIAELKGKHETVKPKGIGTIEVQYAGGYEPLGMFNGSEIYTLQANAKKHKPVKRKGKKMRK